MLVGSHLRIGVGLHVLKASLGEGLDNQVKDGGFEKAMGVWELTDQVKDGGFNKAMRLW